MNYSDGGGSGSGDDMSGSNEHSSKEANQRIDIPKSSRFVRRTVEP